MNEEMIERLRKMPKGVLVELLRLMSGWRRLIGLEQGTMKQ